uniref:Uncharacterized protein n=1 Tax=Meloidogyne hapla TaxID=6305 RepID=A0A1I8BUL1_MELHA
MFLNTFFKNVEPLSIFVKISWREVDGNKFIYPHHLTNENKERFDLKLIKSYPKNPGKTKEVFDKHTDGYDNCSFNGNDDTEDTINYSLQIFIGENEIIKPIEVEDNSIVYVTLHSDIAKYKIVTESQEEYFKEIKKFFELPYRYLIFNWQTRGRGKSLEIGCKDKNGEQDIAEINNVIKNEEPKAVKRKREFHPRVKHISECVRVKICPDQQYTLKMLEYGKAYPVNLTCTSAIFEKTVNIYELNIATPNRNSSCILKDEKLSVNGFNDKMDSEEEKVYARISEVFDQKNGSNHI